MTARKVDRIAAFVLSAALMAIVVFLAYEAIFVSDIVP